MRTKTALLCGATGLVGGECLRLLAADPTFAPLAVLTRRPLPQRVPSTTETKLQQHVIDFDELSAHEDVFAVEQIFCALGTTRKQAGSRERFRQVDFGYPLEIARLGKRQGADHFLLVSSIGASARSSFFYTRVKGELEDALSALGYRSLTIVRPSLLLGNRAEFRLGEGVAGHLSFLTPGKYKPVAAAVVAAALVQAAKEDAPGQRIIESRELESVAQKYRSGSAA